MERILITKEIVFEKLEKMGIEVEKVIEDNDSIAIFFTSKVLRYLETNEFRKYIYIVKK